MITKQQVLDLVKKVEDPELYVSIVDLGLIYNVDVTEVDGHPKVKITMTLTTPGCPLGSTINMMIKDALFPLKELNVDKDIEIVVTFDPPWTVEMMNEESRAELGFD
ncbi:MAG: metal-sulfur cluster assembly factor [Patescibacteria group bacterium]